MKKLAVIFGIFLALNCIIGTANADVYWSFGNSDNTTPPNYLMNIEGPTTSFVIPATMVVTNQDLPTGYFSGASALATYNDALDNVGDGWTYGFYNVYPIMSGGVSGPLPIGTYHWSIYGFSGEQDPWIMPNGVYQSIKEACYLNHFEEGNNLTFLPLNDFSVTVSSVPVPPAIFLLGSGLIGLIGIRRKLKK